jgi:hypothetical protein
MAMLVATLFLLSAVTAQTRQAPDSGFTIRAIQTEAPPEIDGVIGGGEWLNAAHATDFIRFEPQRGTQSPWRTDAMVVYDSSQIYVAFVVWDPDAPAAQLTRRDAQLLNDDAVVLLLDTHNDKQSAYYFMTNLLGTQADGRVANDGRTVDDTWDAAWQTAAARTDSGWTVEMAIPFRSMSFASGEDRTWGINFGRSRRRTLDVSYWAGPLENQWRVSQAGAIRGLQIAPPPQRHQIITYGLSRAQQDTTVDFDGGVDARYAITPQLNAFATVNPDFATIEADQERVNLTRFELALPEKRPFFLESAELYRQRIRTFYSRRIADIHVGGQALGRGETWNGHALTTRSPIEGDSNTATYTVGRVQRNLGSSNVGLVLANQTLNGNRGSISADATLFFTRTLGMTAQLVQSWGDFDSGTLGYFIRPSWDTPTSHFHVRFTHLGDNFADNVNAVGFIRDDNRREFDSALEHTFWMAGTILERLRYDSNYNIYYSQQNVLRSWQIDQSLNFEFRNRLSFGAALQEEFKRFESDFRNRAVQFNLGYNTREFNSVQVGHRFGRNFDSDFQLWTAAAAYAVTEGLSLEYELQRLLLDPDPDMETTWIHVARLNQFFTRDLYLRVFFQTNSAIDRDNIQAVFVYRYKPPFGTLQLAYQRGTAEFGQVSTQGHTMFFKATAVF